MKENFFDVGYSGYINKSNKIKRTSFIKKIAQHKIIFIAMFFVFMCLGVNMWLIYTFINILEKI